MMLGLSRLVGDFFAARRLPGGGNFYPVRPE